jgi:hypothetical protein
LEGLTLLTAESYKVDVEKFGGSTSDLPEERSAFNLLSWLKAHVEKIPLFVRGAINFAALASATNFAKILIRKGCTHATGIRDEALGDVSALGNTSDSLCKWTRNFMGHFWAPFGQVSTRQMAEDRRAEVGLSIELA